MENEDLSKCCNVHKGLEENKKIYLRYQLITLIQTIVFSVLLGVIGIYWKQYLGPIKLGITALIMLSIGFLLLRGTTALFYTDLIIKAKKYCRDAKSDWKLIVASKDDMLKEDKLSEQIKTINAKRLKACDKSVKKCKKLGEHSSRGLMSLAFMMLNFINTLPSKERIEG